MAAFSPGGLLEASPVKSPSRALAAAVTAGLMSKADALELELARKVENGEIRMEEALLRRRLYQLGTDDLCFFGGGTGPGSLLRSMARESSAADEVRIARATEGLLEAYRRLTRPEKAGRSWSSARWGLVAKLFAKLRGLAGAAAWVLPHPATNASRDPKCLAETGIDDHSKAGDSIDETEGEMDGRLIRVASRLVLEGLDCAKEKHAGLTLTFEAYSLARLCLTNLRNTGAAIERLLHEGESRQNVMMEIKDSYGALAAILACLRQRVGSEIQTMLEAKQEPLWSAALAACNLGLAREGVQPVRAKVAAKTSSRPSTSNKTSAPGKLKGDPFLPLHQATLLMNLSSLAQVSTPRSGDSADVDGRNMLARLATSDGSSLQNDSASNNGDGQKLDAEDVDWNIEFTASQLRLMQKAVSESQPEVQGAQQLLRATLDCYAKCAEAMSGAYSDEKALRANPAEITRHRALLSLVRELQSLWRDAGAVLVPSRQADLLALERVRRRHERLVLRAFRAGGLEVASVVLARLALVDEMLEEPTSRQLTGELPWELIKPYQLVEGIVHNIEGGSAAKDERRRRRWLRCPHASVHSVLAGEIWRQLLLRFLTVEAAFEPLLACEHCPLTLREFRMALCLLEISVSERIAAMLYEATADASGGDATLRGLLDVVLRYGPTSSGDKGMAIEAAAVAARSLAAAAAVPVAESARAPTPRTNQRAASKRVSVQGDSGRKPPHRASSSFNDSRPSFIKQETGADTSSAATAAAGASVQAPTLPHYMHLPNGAPMVCSRCLKGDVPVLPHTSVQELNRQCALHHEPRDSPSGSNRRASQRKISIAKISVAAQAIRASLEKQVDGSDSDDELGEDVCAEWQGFGEDAIISWATSVLAQGVLLCKDERGIYFKWLARIVLYGVHKDEEHVVIAAGSATTSGAGPGPTVLGKKTAATDISEASLANRRRSLLQSGGSDGQQRRSSFVSELAATSTAPEGPGAMSLAGQRRSSVAMMDQAAASLRKRSATVAAQSALLGGADIMGLKRSVMAMGEEELADWEKELARLQADALAREAVEEREEAIREVSLALPESVLNVFRIDLGLSQLSKETASMDDLGILRSSMLTGMHASMLYSDFTDVITKGGGSVAHRAKRAARGIKILVGLRHLSVPESELQYLQRELASVAENHAPQVNGLLLVAGAARAAQTILISRYGGKAAPSGQQSGSGSQAAELRSPSKTALSPVKRAQDVVSSSSRHTNRCYERSGFEPSSHHVAVALRFLEYELFGTETAATNIGAVIPGASGSDESDEKVVDLAPLLLTQASADRLLEQVRREEEEEEKARRAADKASVTTPTEKKGVPLQLTPVVRVKSIGSHKDTDSSANSSRPGTPVPLRPASPQSQATASSGSPRSGRSRPRSRSSGQHHKGSTADAGQVSGRGSRASSTVALSVDSQERRISLRTFFPPATSVTAHDSVGSAALTDFGGQLVRDDLHEWPPCVQQLFHSVSNGRSWMARTVRPSVRSCKGHRSATAQLAASQMLRSQSAPNVLPRVVSAMSSAGFSAPRRSTAPHTQSRPKGTVVSEAVNCGKLSGHNRTWSREGQKSPPGHTAELNRRCGSPVKHDAQQRLVT